MRSTKLLAVAAVAVAAAFSSVRSAEAAPEFLLPDLTFAARGDGRTGVGLTGDCPVIFNESSFAMYVSRSIGDLTALNSGEGYVLTDSTILDIHEGGTATSSGFHYTGGLNLVVGPGATLSLAGTLTLRQSLVGYDGLGIMTVLATDGNSPWSAGDTLAIDLHLFNVHRDGDVWCADVKGDIAPVVPEPTTLAFLGVTIMGAALSSRRKLVLA